MANAGVYSSIPATLKGSRTSWPEKLKLARAAWSSPRCLLPNKEQLLLDWVCNSLSSYYSHKLPLDPGISAQLWVFLGEALGSTRVQGECRPVSIRAPIAQMLVEQLCKLAGLRPEEDEDTVLLGSPGAATLLACFRDILHSVPLRAVLAAKLELLARLLRALLTMACRALLPSPATLKREGAQGAGARTSTTDFLSISSLLQVLSQALALYTATQRQQVNPQRVFRLLVGQLLGPAILLRHMMLLESNVTGPGVPQPPPMAGSDLAGEKADAGSWAPVARDIRCRLEVALSSALFHADLLPLYRDELLPSRPDGAGGAERHRKTSTKSSMLAPLRLILDVVSTPGVPGWDGTSTSSNVDPVACAAIPLLYRQLLEAYGSGGSRSSDSAAVLCFRALRQMLAVLGVVLDDAAGEEKEGAGAMPLDALGSRHTLLALDQLLASVTAADIYNVAVDRIQHDALQFVFYERLVAALLVRPSPALPPWHRCLRSLLGLNHLIVEPHLQALVSAAWLGPPPSEARGRKARDAVLCALFAVYAKLRQVAKPLGAAFSSLCQNDGDVYVPRPPRCLISAMLGEKLSECFAELPVGQAADVWELALEAVRSKLLPPAAGAEWDPGPLPSVALLLHAVLFRARSLDATWPSPAAARAVRLMESTLWDAIAPILLRCAEGAAGGETAAALEAALTLAHTWAELDLCYRLNCPKYNSPGRRAAPEGGAGDEDDDGLDENVLVGTYDFHCLVPAVPSRVWRGLTRPIRRSRGTNGDGASSRARFLLATLSVQKVRTLSLLRRDAGSGALTLSLRRAARLAVRLAPWTDGTWAAPWDGELSSVDTESSATAHWHLVLSHLPLLLPHLALSDVQAVADGVVDAALAAPPSDAGAEVEAGEVTAHTLAWALLRGPLLPELGTMQAAVLTALVGRAAQALDSTELGRAEELPSALLPALARRDLPWAAEASAAARKAAYVKPHQDDGDQRGATEWPTPARASTWALMDEVAQAMLGGASSRVAPPSLPPARLADLGRVLDALAAHRLDAALPGTHARCFLALIAIISSFAPTDNDSLHLFTHCCHLLTALQQGGTSSATVLRAMRPADMLEALARPLLLSGAATSPSTALEHRRIVRTLFRTTLLAMATQLHGRRSVPLVMRAFSEFLLAQAASVGWRRAEAVGTKRRRRCATTEQPVVAASMLLEMATAFCQAALADAVVAKRRPYAKELRETLIAVTDAMAAAIRSLLNDDDVGSADGKLELLVIPAAVLLEAEPLLLGTTTGPAPLRYSAVYAHVFERVVRRLHTYECGEEDRRRVTSHVRFLRLLLAAGGAGAAKGGHTEAMAVTLFKTLGDLLSAPGVTRSEFSALQPRLSALAVPLAAACSVPGLRVLLFGLLAALSVQRLQGARIQEAISALRLYHLFALADLEGGACNTFWGAAPRFLSAIVIVTREAPRWVPGDAHALVLAALDCAASLLMRGGDWTIQAMALTTAEKEEIPATGAESGPPRLVGPHIPAALAMQAMLVVQLERLPPTHHHEMFHACHELLFSIMKMHPQVMLRAAPAFLGCFHKLVRSAMHEGRLRGDSDKVATRGGGDAAELSVSCAQMTERMYVQIAARIEEFPALAGFMVAQFVQELQKVSLRADVRRPLVEGVYVVLDLCREQDTHVVATTLPSQGLRELFRQLQADHHKHHKYLTPRALALTPDEE